MMGKKGGLGKGLDVLIPKGMMNLGTSTQLDDLESVPSNPQTMKINEIEPNRDQPRKIFDEESLHELSDSIKQYGIIQPIVICEQNGYYQIVTGERRWRAAKLAGLKEVPVVIRKFTEQEIMEISLIENIQREDLNPIEEAMAYQKLIEAFGFTQEELANKISKSRAAIANTMRLLKLDQTVQDLIIDNQISSGHARTLLSLTDKAKQNTVALKIVENDLSVRETEKLVKKINEEEKNITKQTEDTKLEAYREIEEKLKMIMGTKVHIKAKDTNQGKIEIDYYSLDEFERILNILNH